MTLTRIQHAHQDKVTRNARKVNRKVHFASLMDMCHLKHTEFTTHQQTYQGHVFSEQNTHLPRRTCDTHAYFLVRSSSADKAQGHLDYFSPRLLKSHSISSRFRGTLLNAPFTSPSSVPFPTLAPSPMTTPSLLFPSTSSTPASPQGGMLFGRLAEQSPLTRTTFYIFEDNESATKHVNKGRGPTTHHEARAHRVDLDGFSFARSSVSDQRRQHNITIRRHAHKMILTRDRWTQLTPLVNITTHATMIQSNLSVSSAIWKPFLLHDQMCRRIFRCVCNCKADTSQFVAPQ